MSDDKGAGGGASSQHQQPPSSCTSAALPGTTGTTRSQNSSNRSIIHAQQQKLSIHEEEIHSLLNQFTTKYTKRDIEFVPNPCHRALYEGIVATTNDEPLVMHSVSLIYNDFAPIRMAGRITLNHLQSAMDSYVETRREEENRIQKRTRLSLDAIDHGRKAFMAAAATVACSTINRNSNEGELSVKELIDSGIVGVIVETMELDSVEDFTKRVRTTQNKKEKISFQKFICALKECCSIHHKEQKDDKKGTIHSSAVQHHDKKSSPSSSYAKTENLISHNGSVVEIESALDSISKQMTQKMEIALNNKNDIPPREKKLHEKFELMCKTISEWETPKPEFSSSCHDNDDENTHEKKNDDNKKKKNEKKNGRMDQIIEGVVAGTKNVRIVNALRIVYVDITALRVGMDLLMSVMKMFIKSSSP